MGPVGRTPALLLIFLVGLGAVLGALVPDISTRFDQTAPRLGWGGAIVIGGLAAVVAVTARATWRDVQERGRTIHRDRGVTLLAVAKSASTVGAFLLGGYAGFAAAYLDATDTDLGAERVLHGAVSAVAAGLLLAAALWLERALQVPGDGDEDSATEAEPV